MLRTVLFDMGNVLVHFSHERMCHQMAEVCGSSADEVRGLLFDEQLQLDFERGRFTEDEFHQQLQRRFDRAIDREALIRAASDIFWPNRSIVPVLDALRSRGMRLVLLSNTSVSHLNWVRGEYDLLDRFDSLVTSFEAGAIKPEPAIFAAALRAIECPPDRCFYTDDIAPYVEAGRTYGLDAEVFVDTPTLLRQLAERGMSLE
jgi:putative hydrolase of the HAD superfamily